MVTSHTARIGRSFQMGFLTTRWVGSALSDRSPFIIPRSLDGHMARHQLSTYLLILGTKYRVLTILSDQHILTSALGSRWTQINKCGCTSEHSTAHSRWNDTTGGAVWRMTKEQEASWRVRLLRMHLVNYLWGVSTFSSTFEGWPDLQWLTERKLRHFRRLASVRLHAYSAGLRQWTEHKKLTTAWVLHWKLRQAYKVYWASASLRNEHLIITPDVVKSGPAGNCVQSLGQESYARLQNNSWGAIT